MPAPPSRPVRGSQVLGGKSHTTPLASPLHSDEPTLTVLQGEGTGGNHSLSADTRKLRTVPHEPSRILVADDDALVRGSLAAVLESEGFDVDEACDGHEAVKQSLAKAPDLILLDLNMPGWDGWTAFRQLDRVRPRVPVIVITARPNQYERAVKLGVDAFMEKPLNFHALLPAIRQLIAEDTDRYLRRNLDRNFVTARLGATPPDR